MNFLSNIQIDNVKLTLKGLPEKGRRLFLAREALAIGYGGISFLSKAVGVSRGVITRGIVEVNDGIVYKKGDRNRKSGAGRPTLEEVHRKWIRGLGYTGDELKMAEDIYHVIDTIVDNFAYGDPMTNQAWINTTVKSIDETVYKMYGVHYSHTAIKRIVKKLGYSLQKNQKYNQVGEKHPMRDKQFKHIADMKLNYLSNGDPVISIDTKAKEKIGDYINPGSEYRHKGDPRRVFDHDFALKFRDIYPAGSEFVPQKLMDQNAVAAPNGVYCLNTNNAYVSIGISHDTASFSAETIRRWWKITGHIQFPQSKRLLILADGGGSNSSRGFLWKEELQKLSNEIGITIAVCHYPPGTSKYNPIERRCWSQVSRNWTAKPLSTLETIRGYISSTTTKKGLVVKCEIDSNIYLTEREKKELLKEGQITNDINDTMRIRESLNIQYRFDEGDMKKWNYSISPQDKAS